MLLSGPVKPLVELLFAGLYMNRLYDSSVFSARSRELLADPEAVRTLKKIIVVIDIGGRKWLEMFILRYHP